MKEKLNLLKRYLQSNTKPILFTNLSHSIFDSYVALPATLSIDDLNGHYEGIKYLPPVWYQNLCLSKNKLLIIDNLESVSKKEQKKFIEILEYKKVGVFYLPKETKIIVTTNKIEKIDDEILSFCVVI